MSGIWHTRNEAEGPYRLLLNFNKSYKNNEQQEVETGVTDTGVIMDRGSAPANHYESRRVYEGRPRRTAMSGTNVVRRDA